jgi:hypothetical protein
VALWRRCQGNLSGVNDRPKLSNANICPGLLETSLREQKIKIKINKLYIYIPQEHFEPPQKSTKYLDFMLTKKIILYISKYF